MALANTSGIIVERFRYEAHGRSTALNADFAPRAESFYNWEYRYTGRELDLNTGLYYFRNRFYHSDLGRFISRDPIGYVDGMSLYRGYFVLNGIDPFGNANQLVGTILDFAAKASLPATFELFPIPLPIVPGAPHLIFGVTIDPEDGNCCYAFSINAAVTWSVKTIILGRVVRALRGGGRISNWAADKILPIMQKLPDIVASIVVSGGGKICNAPGKTPCVDFCSLSLQAIVTLGNGVHGGDMGDDWIQYGVWGGELMGL